MTKLYDLYNQLDNSKNTQSEIPDSTQETKTKKSDSTPFKDAEGNIVGVIVNGKLVLDDPDLSDLELIVEA